MTIPGPSDNCGNCVTAERSVTVAPHSVRFADDRSFRADYRCPKCGHRWYTSWIRAETAATIAPPPPAPLSPARGAANAALLEREMAAYERERRQPGTTDAA